MILDHSLLIIDRNVNRATKRLGLYHYEWKVLLFVSVFLKVVLPSLLLFTLSIVGIYLGFVYLNRNNIPNLSKDMFMYFFIYRIILINI